MGMGDKFEAGMDKAKGKAKEAVGKATDNTEMVVEGKLDQAEGEAKSAAEKLKDRAKDALD